MKIQQLLLSNQKTWSTILSQEGFLEKEAQLVYVFGSIILLEKPENFQKLKKTYPNANIVLASTAGEIGKTIYDDQNILVTAICFEKTKLKCALKNISEVNNSSKLGEELSNEIIDEGLKHIFIVSDGQKVNGSELVKGIRENTPEGVIISGGMAGDDGNFVRTLVGFNEIPAEGNVVLIGFYGDNFKVTYGAKGGWDEFGPHRIVTKSDNNVLYELDGQNALELYKKYLGEKADQLPGSALLFPLNMRESADDEALVRTVLSVDEQEGTMTFAGNIIEGSTVRFMKANFDRIVEGAIDAAVESKNHLDNVAHPELVLMVSCVGRKLVLGQRIEEEVEAVVDVFGEESVYAGFFSNGEISPLSKSTTCELHNQTMTITTLSEF